MGVQENDNRPLDEPKPVGQMTLNQTKKYGYCKTMIFCSPNWPLQAQIQLVVSTVLSLECPMPISSRMM